MQTGLDILSSPQRHLSSCLYHIYPTHSDREAQANNVDYDQMPYSVASDQGLHLLPLVQQFLDPSTGSKIDLFKV